MEVHIHTCEGAIYEGGKWPAQNMPSSQYTQSDSAGGSITDTVWMPIECTRWGPHWHIAAAMQPYVKLL